MSVVSCHGRLVKSERLSLTALPAPATLTISAPNAIGAGASFTVTVTSQPAVAHAPLQLLLDQTNGTQLLAGQLQDGALMLPIPASMTEVAGAVTLVARSGAVTAQRTLTILPGAPVEPVVALVGPRSITADGEHWTMVTALPHDRFGNAVAEGTVVTVRVQHPTTASGSTAADIELLMAKTNYLLAWLRVFSRTVAGRMEMAATVGAAHSQERTVLAVPGPPVAFALHDEPIQRNADGRQLVTIYTDPLQDRFGNSLLDGTAVTFMVTDPDGTTRTLPTQSIDGKATVQLQSPTIPGTVQVAALVHNTTSAPLRLDFNAGIGIAPITVRAVPSADLLTLIAGPLLGPLAQYIPDGSEVRFALQPIGSDEATLEVTAPASAGFATTVIRNALLPTGRYRIVVRAGVGTGETIVAVGEP